MAGAADRAKALEDSATDRIRTVTDGPRDPRDPGALAYLMAAQTEATLALSHRTEILSTTLLDCFGDDSNLDRIKQALFDPEGGCGLVEAIIQGTRS